MGGRTAVPRQPRRRTDRLEDAAAWLLVAAGLLVLFTAALVTGSAMDRGAARATAEAASRTRTTAVLLEQVPVLPSRNGVAMAAARWTAPDGRPGEGRVVAMSGTPAGAVVTMWVDRSGRAAPAPLTQLDAVAGGVASGVLVLVVGGLGLAVGWAGVRAWTGARNAAAWERDWARVGPVWTRNLR